MSTNASSLAHKIGEPTWDIALLFPLQGQWTEEDYLALDTNRLIELVDGCLEILPMPTPYHQAIVRYLFRKLDAHVTDAELGEAFFAPLPVRLWKGRLREPDLLFARPERIPDRHKPPEGADLAMEVVSEGEENRARDFLIKRADYARAKIAEYWIVDPQEKQITVLVLSGRRYRVHGVFGQERGELMKQQVRKVLGNYMVADPEICHGKPTFTGTRIMVAQVLEQVGDGMSWDAIVKEWRGDVSKEAIAEAVKLAGRIFADHANKYSRSRPRRARVG